MDDTKVNTADLLERLRANREKHQKQFKKARKVWLKQAIKQLRKVADKAEETGRLNNDSFSPLRKLPKPTSYVASYDLMIARLEAEVEPTVELSSREFQSYWLDKWDWKGEFVGTTSLYSNA